MKAYLITVSKIIPENRSKIPSRKGETTIVVTHIRKEVDLIAAGVLAGFPSSFPIEMTINDEPFDSVNRKITYYPDPQMLPPECRISALCSLAGLKKEHRPRNAKTFGDLSPDGQIEFISALLKNQHADIYVLEKFPGFYPGNAASEMQKQLDSRRSPDSLVLFLEDHKFCDMKRDRMLLVHMNKGKFEYHVIA
jgi:hypothetical protein